MMLLREEHSLLSIADKEPITFHLLHLSSTDVYYYSLYNTIPQF